MLKNIHSNFTIIDEFTSVYVLNLRGNQRTSGELSRKEGGKIFGSGSRTPISITFLVKNPVKKGQKAVIHYHDIGDYLTREQKLKMVKDFRSISSQKLEWKIITPNDKADWINQRDGVFDNLFPLAPEKKFALNTQSVFSTYAIGVATNRDAWVSGFSKDKVTSNMRSMIDFYNQQIDENKLSSDTTKISWTVNLKKDHESKVRHNLKENAFVETFYRPFNRINLLLSSTIYRMTGGGMETIISNQQQYQSCYRCKWNWSTKAICIIDYR